MNTLKCVDCEIETKSKDFTMKCPICNGVMVKKEEYKKARREYVSAKLENQRAMKEAEPHEEKET